ncbi:hypothetical protein RRV45_09970 [Bacillus sp. DTU_2020_1000418_1_SI_GHA_SEK_038]|uniref:hypothetical protein n=1 Tax=Bacillus sp. DTU_2020_1000418_1_SI_GHA_SEK_038 TaxID=3077585 RepID=UPI0028E828E4|nr:hypothetical protein [Bacillus sp. DTU_2020_1000418_1_SI_GHA_SEK_038]WNS77288.1 hypothetical protein RRV45_09970 [Bacillus sp. DTU_2020_1000418_1_SI_GHA_SEK_038]
MNKYLFILIGFLLLTGCTEKQPQSPKPKFSPEEIKIDEYFPQANKKYEYHGEGNEYAAFTEVFYQRTDSYLPSIIDNGGTRILRIYKFTDDGIYRVYEQPEYYDETIPSLEELKKHFKPVPLLIKPLQAGKTFNGFTITHTNAELALPIGNVKNVIIIEQQDKENETIVRKYWAPGMGMVKQEFISSEKNTDDYSVTSELENIQ